MLRLNCHYFKFENVKLYDVSNCNPHEDYMDDSEQEYLIYSMY